jgi:gliding motility-associated-like protein
MKKIFVLFIILNFSYSKYTFAQNAGNCVSGFSTTDYISLGEVLNNLSFPFTFSAWIYQPTLGPNSYSTIFSSCNSLNGYHGFYAQLDNSNRLFLSFGNGNGCYTPACRKTYGINFPVSLYNTWVNVSIVCNSFNNVEFYLNGIPANIVFTGGSATQMVNSNVGDARIGQYYQVPVTGFIGKIDELSLWSRSLTLNEVRENMCKNINVVSSNDLELYYKFNEAIGSTTFVNNGTISSANNLIVGNITREISGAPIGDTSIFDYVLNPALPTQLVDNFGNTIRVNSTNFSSNVEGVHIYKVNGNPNHTNGIIDTSCVKDDYYGIFPASATSSQFGSYETQYISTQNSEINFYNRNNNASLLWQPITNNVSVPFESIFDNNDRQEIIIDITNITTSNTVENIQTCNFPLTLTSNLISPNSATIWNTGQSSNSINASDTGTFILTITTELNICEYQIDTVIFNVSFLQDTIFGQAQNYVIDTCQFPIFISANSGPNSNVVWNTNEITDIIAVNDTGNYVANIITNLPNCTLQIDTTKYFVSFNLDTLTSNTTELIDTCDFPLVLTVPSSPNSSIIWNNNSTLSSLTVFNSGVFSSTVSTFTSNCTLINNNYEFVVNNLSDTIYFQQNVNIDTCDFPIDIGVSLGLNASVLWSTGEVIPIINVNTFGTYIANVFTPQPNCIIENETIVFTISNTYLNISGSYNTIIDTVCFPYNFQISNPSNLFIEWENSSNTNDSILTNASNFNIYFIDSISSCEIVKDTLNYNFIENDISIVYQNYYDTLYSCEYPIEISPSNLNNRVYFHWQNGSSFNEYFEINQPGVYEVNLLSDTVNCEVFIDSVQINVQNYQLIDNQILECSELNYIFIPNTFTPNNDGINDRFRILGNHFTSFQIDIYNRWGELIYTSDSQNEGWNGKINGVDASQGVYSAILTYSLNKENSQIIKYFHINLLR